MKKNSTLLSYRKRLMRVLIYIERNLDAEISLDKLADIANFSPYHFHRIFSGMVGESVKSYVRRLRLDRAASQLLQTEQHVTDIALNSGYEAVETFSKAFQKQFTVNPSKYRHYIRRKRLEVLENFINQLPKGETKMQVKIETVTKMKVAFVRNIGPYMEAEKAWQKLLSCQEVTKTFIAETKFLGVCYDDPKITAPDKIRYDACITVPNDFKSNNSDIGIQEVGGGKYAITQYIGPYTGLAAVYAELYGNWLLKNGHEPKSEPSFEIYKNDPKTTPPEKLITEIYAPIK